MAWETRRRGGLYYTRSKKVDGRVVREYVGGGLAGQLAAASDAAERANRQARAESWRDERSRLEEVDASMTELCEVAERLAHVALELAGYRRHHRGEWRRRHGNSDRPD